MMMMKIGVVENHIKKKRERRVMFVLVVVV